MHCEACVSKIEKALHSIKGIEKATVNLNDETAIIQGDSKLDEVINVIFDLGYTATLNDNSAIKELMPDFEYTPFEKGIKETVSWFIENYESARK